MFFGCVWMLSIISLSTIEGRSVKDPFYRKVIPLFAIFNSDICDFSSDIPLFAIFYSDILLFAIFHSDFCDISFRYSDI